MPASYLFSFCFRQPRKKQVRLHPIGLGYAFASASRFREGGFSSVGHLDPFRVRRGLGVVVVVPVPPLVRQRLGIALGRILPDLLATEGGMSR
jgi:hypothetical protein